MADLEDDLQAWLTPLITRLQPNERSKLAKQQGVPPYVIFHDTTLRAMALARPRSLRDMEEIPGMGTTKLDRYGAAFLKVIAAA